MKKFEELGITSVTKEKFVEMVQFILDSPNEEFNKDLRSQLVFEIELLYNASMTLRNHFRLWENSWEPEIDEGGCDCSNNHPDNLSYIVLQVAHEIANSEVLTVNDL